MKKILRITLKVTGVIVALIIAMMIVVPVFFKEQIKELVVKEMNEMVNADVEVGDFSMGFFKHFPNLAFSLNDVYVTGVDNFQGDTLAGFRSLSLVFNLRSLFGDDGYEVKSIIVNRAIIHGKVLTDGSANWDIMKYDEEAAEEIAAPTTDDAEGTMKLLLREFIIKRGTILYTDQELNMTASFENVNFTMSGDLTETITDIEMSMTAEAANVTYDGVQYIRKATAEAEMKLLADLDEMRFTFRDNYFMINDLMLRFAGGVAMPGDDIITDIDFESPKSDFKSLLSMVPAIYMTDFDGLKADGSFELKGSVKGRYNSAEEVMPDAKISIRAMNGVIDYPDLPEKITGITMDLNIDFNGTDMDKTVVDMPMFRFDLAGNPFKITLNLKTPMSDPEIVSSAIGTIDFGSLKNAIPLDDIKIDGKLQAGIEMAGKMSAIEEERYQDFHVAGRMVLTDFLTEMPDMPAVRISSATFSFSPEYAELRDATIILGDNSDFRLSGNLANYIPWLFADGTLIGRLTLGSSMIDMDEIMGAMPAETDTEEPMELALIRIPPKIDFEFVAAIEKLVYGNIKPHNIRGKMIVRDEMLTITDTGLEMIGGRLNFDALYDTRDSLKPSMKADMQFANVQVKEAFETFNTVQKITPAAKGIDGAMNFSINFESLLGADMMPVINTLQGYGVLSSNELQILDMPTFDQFRSALKLSDNYTNVVRDLRVSFRISDGRIHVSPFDTRLGNVAMNVSGDQGFDQTLNYLVKTEVPRSDLGASFNELVDNLSAQAARFGASFTPSDVIKVNLRVTGTATRPVVVPDFTSTGAGAAAAAAALRQQAQQEIMEKVEEVTAEITDRAREELEKQAERIMKEAEELAARIREEGARAAEATRREADAAAQKLIDEAASRGTIARAAAQRAAEVLRNEGVKRAEQIDKEAGERAQKILDEAAAKRDELLKR